jgi:NAD(P)-dependent dehydrogenase (short-subunit alcohol dehydrogenase family)
MVCSTLEACMGCGRLQLSSPLFLIPKNTTFNTSSQFSITPPSFEKPEAKSTAPSLQPVSAVWSKDSAIVCRQSFICLQKEPLFVTMSQPAFNPRNNSIVVTGGGSGIGAALCEAFAQAGARRVVIADLDITKARSVASNIQASGLGSSTSKLTPAACDVTNEKEVGTLIRYVEDTLGDPIDLFVANAGIYQTEMTSAGQQWKAPSLDKWNQTMDVNVNQHLHVLKHVLPRFQSRKRGHFLFTASAAGLLIHPDSLSYTVSKAAAVSLAEWVAITVGPASNIGVSVLCPQAVDTPMIRQRDSKDDIGPDPSMHLATLDGILQPSDVASTVLKSLSQGMFLILPHTIVQRYVGSKASNREKWIAATRHLVKKSRQKSKNEGQQKMPANRSKL